LLDSLAALQKLNEGALTSRLGARGLAQELHQARQASQAASESCEISLQDGSKGMHVIVEKCLDVGTFSLGGIYNGGWEKLSYYYPHPWIGSYISVKLGDVVYSTSREPKGASQMDELVAFPPQRQADKIVTDWLTPEKVGITQTFELKQNTSSMKIIVSNGGDTPIDAGVRIHLDTLLGENDGAPIYIPGDGLKTRECVYEIK